MCCARLSQPRRTPSGSSGKSAVVERLAGDRRGPRPPCILSARIVATITAAAGRMPDSRHLMSTNFWKPMSEPKPASVTTASTSLSAIRSATTDELPWAMLANGPAWMKAGPPSSVWTRLGLIASRMSTVIAPATRELLERHRLALKRLGRRCTDPVARAGRGCPSPGRGSPSPLTRP